jgi:CBS domain containing-hemolysin-like protein
MVRVVNVSLLVLGSVRRTPAEIAKAQPAGRLHHPRCVVPETLTGMELLEQFRADQRTWRWWWTEIWCGAGLMTPMDMLEAITGSCNPAN